MSCKQMVIKWIKAIFSKHIFAIIKGNFNRLFRKEQFLFDTRYINCKDCNLKENSPIGEICGLCGCPLESKLRVLDEECEIKKW